MGGMGVWIAGAVLAFAVIFVTGYGLGRGGKPYAVPVLTAHKLIGLAAAVGLALTAYQANAETALDGTAWIAVGAAGLLFLGTGATGALVSTDLALPGAIRTAHRIAPYLILLSTSAALWLLPGRG